MGVDHVAAWVLGHGGWVGSTPSSSSSRAWTGLGLGIWAGLIEGAGISCMPARAVRMSRTGGRAGCRLYSPWGCADGVAQVGAGLTVAGDLLEPGGDLVLAGVEPAAQAGDQAAEVVSGAG